MNREIKNSFSTEVENNTVYYARVASTEGNGVKIYRYGINEQCHQMMQTIWSEKDSLRRAVLQLELVQFISEHLGEYSGDRKQLVDLAAEQICKALHTVEATVLQVERSLRYAQRTLRSIEQEYKAALTPRNAPTKRGEGVVYSTDSQRHLENILPAEVKAKLSSLRETVKKRSRQYNDFRKVCPLHIAEQIVKTAEEFEAMGYPL